MTIDVPDESMQSSGSRRVFGDISATGASSMQEDGYGYEHETREPSRSSRRPLLRQFQGQDAAGADAHRIDHPAAADGANRCRRDEGLLL